MGTITQTSIEGGYKKFGKVMQPTLLTTKAMGVDQRIALDTIEYDTVQPSVFEAPAAIKALIK